MESSELFSFYEEENEKSEEKQGADQEKRGRKPLSDAFDPEILHEISKKKLTKLYYGIGEVADMFHVNTSLIRYWDNEFPILKPRKNRKGDRLFKPEDIRNLQLIYYLLKDQKFTIEGAKKRLKEDRKAMEENFEMVQSLQRVRRFLVELKEHL